MSLLMQALKKAEHAKKKVLPSQEEQHNQQLAGDDREFPALDSGLPFPEKSAEKIEPQLNLSAPDINVPSTYQIDTSGNEPPFDSTLHLADPEAIPNLTIQPAPPTKVAAEDTPTLSDMTYTSASQERHIYTEPPVVNAPRSTETPMPPGRKNENQMKQTPLMAQTILASKQPERSNRRAYWVGGAVIFLVLAGAGFYLWQMLQIPNLAPKGSAQHKTQPITNSPTVNPELPTQSALSAPTAPPIASVANATGNPQPPQTDNENALPASTDTNHKSFNDEFPVIKEEPRSLSPNQIEQSALIATANQIKINKSIAPSNVNANLVQAYRLFYSGDTNAAKPFYDKVLLEDSSNRDALLGLAAIALKNKQSEQASAYYSKLLDLNPADPDAIAGLTSLKKSNADQSESQLKKVLAQNPQSGASLFELGNVYMQQSRWSEAQEMFFRAFGTSPNNADFAYNLAISLDRLEQTKLALDYYQRALSLSKSSSANFDPENVKIRINQLQHTAAE